MGKGPGVRSVYRHQSWANFFDFLVFTNASTGTLAVLYRRQDGNYGLIEPEVR